MVLWRRAGINVPARGSELPLPRAGERVGVPPQNALVEGMIRSPTRRHTIEVVIAGLDPAIHLPSIDSFEE
jgi:hypothetical protein